MQILLQIFIIRVLQYFSVLLVVRFRPGRLRNIRSISKEFFPRKLAFRPWILGIVLMSMPFVLFTYLYAYLFFFFLTQLLILSICQYFSLTLSLFLCLNSFLVLFVVTSILFDVWSWHFFNFILFFCLCFIKSNPFSSLSVTTICRSFWRLISVSTLCHLHILFY